MDSANEFAEHLCFSCVAQESQLRPTFQRANACQRTAMQLLALELQLPSLLMRSSWDAERGAWRWRRVFAARTQIAPSMYRAQTLERERVVSFPLPGSDSTNRATFS